jgi:hypothetical protein
VQLIVAPGASVNTVVWCCRVCDHQGAAITRDTAQADGVDHLAVEHHATIGTTTNPGRAAG